VQGMVQVVRPASVEMVLVDQLRVVEIALRDRQGALGVHRVRDLLQDVSGRIVVDAMDGIEAQAVEPGAGARGPTAGVFHEMTPHRRKGEVDGVPPGRLVLRGE